MINMINHSKEKKYSHPLFLFALKSLSRRVRNPLLAALLYVLPPSVSQPMVVIPVGPDVQQQGFDFSATFKCLDLW